MSIAVSAVVNPSKLAMAMVGTIFIGTILVGVAILIGRIGDLQPWTRILLVLFCWLAGGSGFYSCLKFRKAHHIDISGIGQIRLVEDSALAAASFCNISPEGQYSGDVVSLMDDSTLLPYLLLLRLKTADQSTKVIFVLPDSVDKSTFKALLVAFRWIATRNNLAKILSADNF